MKTGYVCSKIFDYMNNPSLENAKKLFPLITTSKIPFIQNINFKLIRNMDVDGFVPYEQEYCDKFCGLFRNDVEAFAIASTCASNVLFDFVKTNYGWKTEYDWLL